MTGTPDSIAPPGPGDPPLVARIDCLEGLAGLAGSSIDFAYLDPPFNTGRPQRRGGAGVEDAWPDWPAYRAFLEPRIEHVHRLLRPTGSIVLHGDWRWSHRLRVLLDDVFGPDRFVNHLVWRYGLGGSSPRRFARKHDDLLLYGRTEDYHFEPPMVPAASRRMRGRLKKADDVLEIPAINNMARERVGWPSQKPLALLRLLVGACSPAGGLVLDPFCGSGTTLVAAAALGRRVIGMDVRDEAVSIARRRLLDAGHDPAGGLLGR